ncbi:hypothetical protein [Saccharothrix sp.]|uniref:hypothetical protein n=1 Tax=Saccharothrix sp. TaxID=1873460 RepID=UPI0028121622|nr:hypothetical protein [Saccharothrix sp.]
MRIADRAEPLRWRDTRRKLRANTAALPAARAATERGDAAWWRGRIEESPAPTPPTWA